MKVEPVHPIGLRKTVAFVTRADSCALEDVAVPVYPKNPHAEELRRRRIALGFSLGDGASVLGITAAEMSGLEHGRMEFEGTEDAASNYSNFQRAIEALEKAARK
jgi:hypothetical protein